MASAIPSSCAPFPETRLLDSFDDLRSAVLHIQGRSSEAGAPLLECVSRVKGGVADCAARPVPPATAAITSQSVSERNVVDPEPADYRLNVAARRRRAVPGEQRVFLASEK